jgi:predicted RNase H-like nuclease (RuvC/YqgF family)
MRDQLKSIRTREENLDELKCRRKSLGAKADAAEKKLMKMGSEHKNMQTQTDLLNALRAEMRNMDSDIMSEEAYLGDFKRSTTKTWMTLKFGGMLECSEKGTVSDTASQLSYTL